jgi:hypothetical protein
MDCTKVSASILVCPPLYLSTFTFRSSFFRLHFISPPTCFRLLPYSIPLCFCLIISTALSMLFRLRSFITSRCFSPSPLFSLRSSLSPSLSPFLRVPRLLLLFSTHLGTKNETDNSYPLPPSCEDTEILRVVVRESLSGDLARKLLADIIQV